MIATDPLSLLFIICFAIGVLYVMIMGFSGGLGSHGHAVLHHDAGIHVDSHVPAHIHVDGHMVGVPDVQTNADIHHVAHYHNATHSFSIFSIFNPTSIVLFLLGFGAFGYILHNGTSFEVPIILIIASICGVIIASIILITLTRIFANSEASTILDVSDRTGLLGKVDLTIPERGIGEIVYTSPGNLLKSVAARSVDGRRLEQGQEIVVVNYQQGIAEVDTWDHFVNQETTPPMLTAENDDIATLRALLEENPNNTISDSNDSNKSVIQNDTQKE